jgi:hypothetical protein
MAKFIFNLLLFNSTTHQTFLFINLLNVILFPIYQVFFLKNCKFVSELNTRPNYPTTQEAHRRHEARVSN